MMVRALAMAALCSVGFAQVNFRGVVSGYMLDGRSGTLRPVLGIPGAAYLGDSLPLAWGVTAAAIRGSRDVAVVISNEQPRGVYILHNLSGAVAAIRLDGAMPDSDRVVLSGDGSTAALASSSQRQIQLVTKLASVAAVSDAVPLGVRGGITAMAISNSGCAAVAAADSQSGQVVQVCASNSSLTIPIFDREAFRSTAIAWLDNQKAAVADAASNQVLLFANLDGSAPTLLLDGSDGVDVPVGLAAIDSQTLAVANSGAGTLLVARTDRSTAPRSVPLPAAPTMLDVLDSASILVSNALLDLRCLLVDARQDYGAFFVPVH